MQIDKFRARLSRSLFRFARACDDTGAWLDDVAARVRPLAPPDPGSPFHARGCFVGYFVRSNVGSQGLVAVGPKYVPFGETVSLPVCPAVDFQPTRLVLSSASSEGAVVNLNWPTIPAGSPLKLHFKRGGR